MSGPNSSQVSRFYVPPQQINSTMMLGQLNPTYTPPSGWNTAPLGTCVYVDAQGHFSAIDNSVPDGPSAGVIVSASAPGDPCWIQTTGVASFPIPPGRNVGDYTPGHLVGDDGTQDNPGYPIDLGTLSSASAEIPDFECSGVVVDANDDEVLTILVTPLFIPPSAGQSGTVTSFNTRTGAVVPALDDYESLLLTDATLDAGFNVADANGFQIKDEDDGGYMYVGTTANDGLLVSAVGTLVELVANTTTLSLSSGGLNGSATINAPFQLLSSVVASLPSGVLGQIMYASDGLKVGETTGHGTGVIVYYSNSAWRVFSTDAQVQS